MNFKNIYSKIKKNWGSLLLITSLIIITLNPDAKSWLLHRLVSTGLFNAEIKKDKIEKKTSLNACRFTNVAGDTINTATLKGKIILINFWASWCPPCRAEMPSLVTLYKEFKNKDRYVFLFINEDENKGDAMKFLKKNQYDIPLYSRSGSISDDIFSGTLPTTIVIDTAGNVVLKHEGMADYSNAEFIKQLSEL